MEKQIVIEDSIGVLKACDGSTELGRAYLGAEEICGMYFTKTALKTLRAALAQPDAAAEARAKLEKAVRDKVISGFSEYAETNEHETWHTVYLKRRDDDGVSRSYWTSERSLGSNVRAMQCAAAHVESLRKPVVVEPESMTHNQRCRELESLGWHKWFSADNYPGWADEHFGKRCEDGATWEQTTLDTLKEARAAKQ